MQPTKLPVPGRSSSHKTNALINSQNSTTLIVGSGLAGSLLAWRMDQLGQPYQLIGSSTLPNAWSVAAGVINPVTGRWMTKSWEIDRLLPEAEATYRKIEQTLGIQVYHPVPLYRYCQQPEDAKRMGRRMRNPRYQNVLGAFLPAGNGPAALIDPLGSFEILNAAYVDLPTLIQALHTYFNEKSCLRDENFLHAELQPIGDEWHYHDLRAKRVIFCEGTGLRNNPWFNTLPLTPAKGETLILKAPSLELPKSLYHHKKWILPYGDGTLRLGATYDESDLSPEPTQQGYDELYNAARSFIRPEHELQLKAHYSGHRPTTPDARPLLGQHPQARGLYLLNGLGSKGASLAPEMSHVLVEHLENGQPLEAEIDLARFGEPSV